MPRGQKTCPCGHSTGPRAFKCPECGYSFNIQKGVTKRRRKRNGDAVENWKDLKPGDFIRVSSGPYWVNKETQEHESLGYFGLFRIKKVDVDGLGCYPADKRNNGFCYVYMGKTKMGATGVSHMRAHKIRKVSPEYMGRKYVT